VVALVIIRVPVGIFLRELSLGIGLGISGVRRVMIFQPL
jgi:hypothetical protein